MSTEGSQGSQGSADPPQALRGGEDARRFDELTGAPPTREAREHLRARDGAAEPAPGDADPLARDKTYDRRSRSA